MAFLDTPINAADLPESQTYEPIPAGWYSASITECDLKDTKAGTGQYLRVRYDITGPSHEGRVVFGNLNIRNPNPKAEEIGRQQLGSLMRAIGLASLTDTDQLIGGNCQIKVSVRPGDGQYDASNDIKAWKSVSGSPAPAAAPAPAKTAAPAPAAATGSTAPWLRK